MNTTEQFYEDFKDAGFLVPASWTPSVAAGGGAAVSTHVRYREEDQHYQDGIFVGAFPSICFPTSWLPGLIENESIVLDLSSVGQASAVTFTVRMVPLRMLDATECKAFLRGA